MKIISQLFDIAMSIFFTALAVACYLGFIKPSQELVNSIAFLGLAVACLAMSKPDDVE